jgi:hypothetical protein
MMMMMSKMNGSCGFLNDKRTICSLVEPPSRVKVDNALLFDGKMRPVDVEFINGLGLKFANPPTPCGWKKITQDVDMHTDYGVPTFLYIGSGACRLIYGDRENTISLCSGDFMVFNDGEQHGVLLESRSLVFMIASVTGYIKDKAVKNLDQFKGNYR